MAELRMTRTGDGVDLAVEVHSSSPPGAAPLLMIPGLGATRSVMAPLIPGLLRCATTIVYDPRGIGDSGMSDPPWSMAQLADDAAAVIDDVAGGRASVLGASMGGMVAQRLALDHPERVAHLILAATTPGGAGTVGRNRYARERLLGRGARTPADAYRIATTVLYSDAFRHTAPDFIEEQILERGRHPVRARSFTAQNQASLGHDLLERLREITAPTLVLHGTEDVVTPMANAELLVRRIPGARHLWFSGAGHLFFHEQPDRAAAAICGFVSR